MLRRTLNIKKETRLRSWLSALPILLVPMLNNFAVVLEHCSSGHDLPDLCWLRGIFDVGDFTNRTLDPFISDTSRFSDRTLSRRACLVVGGVAASDDFLHRCEHGRLSLSSRGLDDHLALEFAGFGRLACHSGIGW